MDGNNFFKNLFKPKTPDDPTKIILDLRNQPQLPGTIADRIRQSEGSGLGSGVTNNEQSWQERGGDYSKYCLLDATQMSGLDTHQHKFVTEMCTVHNLTSWFTGKIIQLKQSSQNPTVVFDLGASRAETLARIVQEYQENVTCIASNLVRDPETWRIIEDSGVIPFQLDVSMLASYAPNVLGPKSIDLVVCYNGPLGNGEDPLKLTQDLYPTLSDTAVIIFPDVASYDIVTSIPPQDLNKGFGWLAKNDFVRIITIPPEFINGMWTKAAQDSTFSRLTTQPDGLQSLQIEIAKRRLPSNTFIYTNLTQYQYQYQSRK